MIKISNKLKVYLYSSLILTGAAIIIYTFSYTFAFDGDLGYFAASPLPGIASALTIASLLWFLSVAFFIPKNVLDGASPTTLAANVAATPICISEILFGILMIASALKISGSNVFGKIFPDFIPNEYINKTPLLLVCGIFLVISAAYFAMLWFIQDRYAEIKAFVGFAMPISSLLLTAVSYLDLYMAMNSPIKLSFQFAMIAFMLFSLLELRVTLEKPKPRAYFALAMITMLLSGIASVPQIVAFCTGRFNNLSYLFFAIVSLCVFIYVAVRLCIFVSARDLLERISDQTPAEGEEE